MRTRSTSILAALLCLLVAAGLASAAPAGIGTPTMHVNNGGTNLTATLISDGITNGGTAGNGAISWDVFFIVPSGVSLADFTITPGQIWVDQCPGAFITFKSAQTSPIPGQNAFYIGGVCTNTRTGPPVTGNNVLVATLTFNNVCATTGGFNINLHTGGDPQGDLTDMFDTNNDLYLFPDSRLTDGGNLCGGPTAVTTSTFNANSANPAAATSALPLIVGGAVVVAGGAYALLRRKR